MRSDPCGGGIAARRGRGVDERSCSKTIRYVAIGDSYSIGEGASPEECWPALIADRLTREGIQTRLVANPSITGWTTQLAIERELPIFREAKPDFATLLIGVNDWVQGVTAAEFRHNLTVMLAEMLTALTDKRLLLLVTIPDFSVTPEGPRYARGRDIAQGIHSFNEIIKAEAEKHALRLADIFVASQRMRHDASLVAADKLHPSARAYAEWAEIIYPAARELLIGRGIKNGR
jgi:acyl-CoA thioesterase I